MLYFVFIILLFLFYNILIVKYKVRILNRAEKNIKSIIY